MDELRVQRKLQQDIVNQMQAKNIAYSESIQYLKEQLALTNEVKKADKSSITSNEPQKHVSIPVQLGSEKDLSEKILKLKERISMK